MGSLDRKLKAYVRFDGQGRVVSGSLILRRKMPKVGKWMEIQGYECCNTTTTTTTTAIPFDCTSYGVTAARGNSGTYTYIPCGDTEPLGPVPIEGPISLAFCAVTDSLVTQGDVEYWILGECETTTTSTTTSTTTTEPTTTTTSTSTSTTTSTTTTTIG